MKKRKILLTAIVTGVAAVLFSLIYISTTLAISVTLGDGEVLELSNGENILRKWTFMDFYQCAKNDVFKSPIDLNGHRGDVTDDLLNGGGGTYDLPTGLSSDANNKWSCKKAFNGEGLNWRGTSGVLDYLGGKNINWNNSSTDVAPLLTKLGYDPSTTNGSDKDVIEIFAHFSCANGDVDGNGTNLTSLCQSVYGDGELYLGKIKLNGESVWGNLKYKTVDLQNWDSTSTPVFISGGNSKITVGYNGNFNDSVYQQCPVSQKTIAYNKQSFAQTANDISVALGELTCTINVPVDALIGAENVSGSSIDTVGVNVSFSNTNPGDVAIVYEWTDADTMLKRMGFSGGTSDLLLTDNETYGLYEFYVEQALKIKKSSDLKEKLKCATQTNDGTYANYQEIYLKSGGKWKIYYYDPADLKKTSGFNVQNSDLTTSSVSFDEIKARLKAMADAEGGASNTSANDDCTEIDEDVNKVDDKVVNDGSSTQYASSNSGDPSEKCYEAADVLGHTLCPILSAVSQFTDQIYYFIENNFLMVNARMTGDSVRDAWGTVRDIANVGFVIVLLIVIFSQVTGFGIDNYGIKRILPRLIVTAVLVNVSFLICQIMVDISNIVGVSLKDLLSNAIPLEAETIGNSGGAEGILGSIAAGGILVAIVALNPGVILSLVTAIIGVVIALLFLFVILIARQIGVVLMVILSPIAFICYMLPNTEKVFSTWRKIFTALLLAYPICALAMGGGTLVGNLMANIGEGNGGVDANPVLLIGAMIVNVLPFFLIPTILKRSMAGLGNLGATLSGIGQRLGRGATGAMRGSAGFKALQSASADHRNRIRAGLDKEGNLTRIGKLKAGIADSKFGKSVGYGKLQKARIASAEKTITDQALGTGQLVENASAERFQNSLNAIKTQATNDGTINNLAGNNNYAGMGDDFSFDDPSTLEAHAYQAALDGDKEAMYAYTELLSSKGHAGQEGATQVISKLQAQGKHTEAQMMAQAIMNNPNLSGQYKSGARSQYNGLKDLAAAKDAKTVANIRSVSNIKAGDYSKQSLANADKEELARIKAAMNDPSFKGASELRKMAEGALNDSMIEGGTKLKNENLLYDIAGIPKGSVKVDHSVASAGAGTSRTTAAGTERLNPDGSTTIEGGPAPGNYGSTDSGILLPK